MVPGGAVLFRPTDGAADYQLLTLKSGGVGWSAIWQKI
jgi:hypothetical protein